MVSNVHPKKPDSARVDELNKVRELSVTWTTIYPAGLMVVIVSLHNRTAKRLCVTNVTWLLLARFVMIFTSH